MLNKEERLEKEKRYKEIIISSSSTLLALYIVMFTILGKSLFVLTFWGFWIIFLPFWLLSISIAISLLSLICSKIQVKIIIILYLIAILAISIVWTLIYSYPGLFWGQ
jgi:hypothetical protein